jgi:hypothetical protein
MVSQDVVRINIPVKVDTKNAGRQIDFLTRNIKQATKETQKLNVDFQRTSSSIGRIAKGMLAMGVAFAGVAAGISAKAPGLSGHFAILKTKLLGLAMAVTPGMSPIITGLSDMTQGAVDFINEHDGFKAIGTTIGDFLSGKYGLPTVVALFGTLAAHSFTKLIGLGGLGGVFNILKSIGTVLAPAIGGGTLLAAIAVGGVLYLAAVGFQKLLDGIYDKQLLIAGQERTEIEAEATTDATTFGGMTEKQLDDPALANVPYVNPRAERDNRERNRANKLKEVARSEENASRGKRWSKAGGDVGTGVGITVGGILGSFFGPVGTVVGAGIGSQVGKLAGSAVGAGASWLKGKWNKWRGKQDGGIIEKTGAYMLHQGEKVVPRNLTQMGGGSQPIVINIQTGSIRSQADISSLVDQISREMSFRQNFARGVA